MRFLILRMREFDYEKFYEEFDCDVEYDDGFGYYGM